MVPVEFKGVSVGVFLFATTIAGTVAAAVVGAVAEQFDEQSQSYEDRLGDIMAINTVVPCLFATFFFWMAGRRYAEIRREQVAENEDALVKAPLGTICSTYDISCIINMKTLTTTD